LWLEQAAWKLPMISKFILHQHKAGKHHYDLRFIQNDCLRSWSLLKEPPRRRGEKRLAIERERFACKAIYGRIFYEDAFGQGSVAIWDEGELDLELISDRHIALTFSGSKMSGRYELRRMRWYPGNRWMLQKMDD
jgi:bifunctional non-homologous end joining protein LigD